MSTLPRILIVGAGPTGLGAACRLAEHGHDNWHLVEAGDHFGGLASSVIDAEGFTWDMGGHVLFSHYAYFDQLMARTLGDAWVTHEREAWVRIKDRWVPYPFQNNLWRLPSDDVAAAIRGLETASQVPSGQPPTHFGEWLLAAFGQGLCELFMFPYNRKVWAYDPSKLGVGWMGERVAIVDLTRVRRNVEQRKDEVAWGPNATFRFPLHGGTGAIWQTLGRRLPAERVSFRRAVVQIDAGRRQVRFDDGGIERYDRLISTMPLDRLLGVITDKPWLSKAARQFVHSSTHVVGLGFDGPVPDALRSKCWMYFPEANTPFYRATLFSNYSPNNVPRPGEQWSLMAEVSESSERPVNMDTIVNDVIAGFGRTGLLDGRERICSRWHKRLEYGYPTPWLGRDEVLAAVEPVLAAEGIYSRGRFGAWKYEVSNQDHSVLQGVEAVDNILTGTAESTVHGRMDVEPPTLLTSARAGRHVLARLV